MLWEAEIGRIVVPGQPGKKVCKTLSQQKKAEHPGTSLLSQFCQEV
jgi:hypothetical protein